tara:strand:- start:303 stop:485 length:183 start_codon:yes stop_codon:yes gene_type:complete
MAIKIDDIEYESENLTDSSKKILANIQFIQSEVKKLQAQIQIYKIAEAKFAEELKKSLSK